MDKQKAFERDVLPHFSSLYHMALKYTHNEPEAEDLVQDSIIRAYKSFDTFQVGTNCKAWLFRILTNTFINRYRTKRREKACLERIVQDDVKLIQNHAPSSDIELENSYQNKRFAFSDEMLNAIESISNEFKSIIIMADIQELSYKEISEQLNIPMGTVMSRLFRGRQLLRKSFNDYALRTEN